MRNANIDVSVYRHIASGEFFEANAMEVIGDGFDGPRMMVTLTLVEALNELHEENKALRDKLNELTAGKFPQVG
jgi:hypothetical protein